MDSDRDTFAYLAGLLVANWAVHLMTEHAAAAVAAELAADEQAIVDLQFWELVAGA